MLRVTVRMGLIAAGAMVVAGAVSIVTAFAAGHEHGDHWGDEDD
jgi:hypothetical protein